MAKKLNILYHHRTQGRGAEGVHIMSIVNALETMGHTVTIVSPPGVNPQHNAGNAPVDKSSFETSGIDSLWKFMSKHLPDFVFECVEIFYNIPSLIKLERELASQQYDVIYERYAFYMISGAIKARKYKIPLVLEANEVSGINNRARSQSLPWLCQRFERFLFKRCTAIQTVSSFLSGAIIHRGVPAERVNLTPNAINPDIFCNAIDNADLKRQFKLEGKTVIGFAGWFDDWDRLDLLVEAFAHLRSRYDNLVLLLIGDGEVLDQVREKVRQHQLEASVILTGAVVRREVHRYLSLLDIAIFTHSNEFGSPVVMFEFMGLKIPILAPKLIPITDVLHHGQTALLFEVMDLGDMQQKLEDLIRQPKLRQALANAAYELLMQRHTWHMNAKAIVKSATD